MMHWTYLLVGLLVGVGIKFYLISILAERMNRKKEE